MKISAARRSGIPVLRIEGELDAVTAPELEESLSSLVAGRERLVILNLEGLSSVSSAGLRVILQAAKAMGDGSSGELCFVGVRGLVREMFDVTGFSTIFRICEREEEAL